MAIAELGTDATGTEDSADNSITVAHTLAAGSNRLVLIKIGCWKSDGAVTVSSVTYGGVACTEIVSLDLDASTDHFFGGIWYIKEASLPSNGSNNVVVTFGAAVVEKAVVVRALSGVDQTTTFRDNDEISAMSGTSPSLTLTTVADDWVETALTIWQNTPTTSDTEDTHATDANNNADCYSAHDVAVGTSTTVGWTITSQEHVFTAAAVIPAAGGGGGSSIAAIANYHNMQMAD